MSATEDGFAAGRGAAGSAPSQAPHPTLKKHYGRDEERQGFVKLLFDEAAPHYDWICRVLSLGSGQWYRRRALTLAGLRPGMTLLDVATGTGLVARAALEIVGDPAKVVGVDPSPGMLAQAREALPVPLVRGTGESLPFREGRFDVVSMGYALRHVADLQAAFREYLRVLKPGGRLVVLEISRPRSAVGLAVTRTYLQTVVPFVARIGTGSAEAERLMKYYWDTIEHCVDPEVILEALRGSGFVSVERAVMGGILSEYRGVRPGS